MHVINLYQTYADAAVLSGEDRGERSGCREGSEPSIYTFNRLMSSDRDRRRTPKPI